MDARKTVLIPAFCRSDPNGLLGGGFHHWRRRTERAVAEFCRTTETKHVIVNVLVGADDPQKDIAMAAEFQEILLKKGVQTVLETGELSTNAAGWTIPVLTSPVGLSKFEKTLEKWHETFPGVTPVSVSLAGGQKYLKGPTVPISRIPSYIEMMLNPAEITVSVLTNHEERLTLSTGFTAVHLGQYCEDSLTPSEWLAERTAAVTHIPDLYIAEMSADRLNGFPEHAGGTVVVRRVIAPVMEASVSLPDRLIEILRLRGSTPEFMDKAVKSLCDGADTLFEGVLE